jgi:uncharacterized protein (TIGR01319 family)
MSGVSAPVPQAGAVLGDIGSTFIKLISVGPGGEIKGRARMPTAHDDLTATVRQGLASLAPGSNDVTFCSSAGGGLRIVVLGLEHALTVEAGRRTSATAGGRVIGVYGRDDLSEGAKLDASGLAPDVALLTGGTDGGDEDGILRAGEALSAAAPSMPVVVAGNRNTYGRLHRILGNGRPVHFVDNVMPRVGELSSDAAQAAIRRIFIEHVIGRGRFASGWELVDRIRMPTPAAVMAAAEAVAELGVTDPALEQPVIVDLGGATTDVYSVMTGGGRTRGYDYRSFPDQLVTRTVEGDLGMRENASALLQVARQERYVGPAEVSYLLPAVDRRTREPDFLPATEAETRVDETLASLACAQALHRHAGVLRTTLSPAGVTLEKTGRDLREATCLILTGGVFEHSQRPAELARTAIRMARQRGALLPEEIPLLRDRSYALWAAGLLRAREPELSRGLLRMTLERLA